MSTTIAPALGHGILMTQGGVGASGGYDAVDVRRMALTQQGEGVQSYESWRVRQRAAGGPGMFVDIGMDEGAYVRGDAVALQAPYFVAPHSALITEAVTAADPTNPRVDQLVLELKDTTHDASGANLAQTRVVAGTPTGGTTLDTRAGAAALPASAILLADFLVPALATTVVDANIRDRRPFLAGIPPLLTDVDMVALEPVTGYGPSFGSPAISDLQQLAYAVRLPRRIVSATRIRWKYVQGGTALTGNYVLGIYDSSGRRIVDTGSVAFTGANGSTQVRSETIAATTFEPGLFYVLWGVDFTNAGSFNVVMTTGSTGFIANTMLSSSTGGATAPNTILAFTDQVATGTGQAALVALSVG